MHKKNPKTKNRTIVKKYSGEVRREDLLFKIVNLYLDSRIYSSKTLEDCIKDEK